MRAIAIVILALIAWPCAAAPDATVAYRQVAGREAPKLDIYTAGRSGKAPVLVFVHGGAWQIGSRSRVHAMPAHFNATGFVFVSIDYGLVPAVTVEDQLADIDAALGWIGSNIARFGGDPGNLHLIGHSAGAHLVAMAALAPGAQVRGLLASGALRSVIANDTRAYDVTALRQATRDASWRRIYALAFGDDPARWARLSPFARIGDGPRLPAFLAIHSGQGGGADRARAARAFADALVRGGGVAETFDAGTYSHAQVNRTLGQANDLTRAVDAFIARHAR